MQSSLTQAFLELKTFLQYFGSETSWAVSNISVATHPKVRYYSLVRQALLMLLKSNAKIGNKYVFIYS